MPAKTIFYIYPATKWVSFRTIAEHHINQLRRFFRVEKVDESAITVVMSIAVGSNKSLFIVHPYFRQMRINEKNLVEKIGKLERIIGVDVADGICMTKEAVRLTEYAEAMIVPSNFSRNSYINSGVRKPVHVVPHGVSQEYINASSPKPTIYKPLSNFKAKTGRKLVQTWVLHSEFRKGLDIAYKIMNILLRERNDVAFVLRTATYTHVITKTFKDKPEPDVKLTTFWLTDQQIHEIMDICDIYLLTSRGGAFEHPALQALARGEVALGAKGGAWQDYLPEWALIPSCPSDKIYKNELIYDGIGVEMLPDKAVDILHGILNNLDDYRAKVKEYVHTHVKQNFTWEKIGLILRDIVENHM